MKLKRIGAHTEKELQDAIAKLLAYKGITAIRSRMDRRTSNNLGTPDFLFAVKGQAVAWEVKMPGKLRSDRQIRMAENLGNNGWDYKIITTITEAIEELERLQNGSTAGR